VKNKKEEEIKYRKYSDNTHAWLYRDSNPRSCRPYRSNCFTVT